MPSPLSTRSAALLLLLALAACAQTAAAPPPPTGTQPVVGRPAQPEEPRNGQGGGWQPVVR
jgi:hypothetical protein